MPIEELYVSGPYQGVSQAPPQVRLPEACQDMQDCIATIPMGIQKRPPFGWMGQVTSDGLGNSFALQTEIPRGTPATDVTLVLNNNGSHIVPHLFLTADPTSAPISVTVTTAAQTYLDTLAPLPNRDLRVCSVEDFTFIANRLVTVANGSATAGARPFEALLWVKTGQYGRNYIVTVTPGGGSPQSFAYHPSSGASGNDAYGVGTDVIVNSLCSGTVVPGSSGVYTGAAGGMQANLPPAGINVTPSGSTIYLSITTPNFTVTVTDDQGGTAFEAIKSDVQNFSDLPAVAVDGFVARVLQSQGGQAQSTGNSDYFVKFVASAPPQGTWQECVAPGTNLGVNPDTLPVALTFNGSTWTIDVCAWKPRATGDTTLNPDPAFIGDNITDIRWYRGRLELIFNGGCIFSDSADPFNYYTTTLAASLDSDPMGFLTPVDRKTFFKAGVNFDNRAIIMGDKVQAIISSSINAPFATDNARIDLLSSNDFNDAVPVLACNHRIYFTAQTSGSSLVYELAIDRLSGLALVEELSTAVPAYLPATIDRAANSQPFYFNVYGSSGSPSLLVHVPRYNDQQRVQNAFYRWNMPPGFTLCGLISKGSLFYFLAMGTDDNLYRFGLDIAPDQLDSGGTIRTYLDLKFRDSQCSPSYSTTTGLTTITPPAGTPANMRVSLRGSSGSNGYPEGYIVPVDHTDSSHLYLKGDWHTATFWVGYTYASYYVPTEWFITGQDGRPQHSGRLSLKRLDLDVADFGYLRVEVSISGRTMRPYIFEGVYLDDPTRAGLDAPPNSLTRVLSCPIGGNSKDTSIKIVNDSHLGFKSVGYTWQGDWNPRARRAS